MSFHPFPILASCVEFQRLRWPSGRVLFSTIQSDSIPFEDPHTQNLTYKRDHKIRCKDWCMCRQPFLFQLWQAFHEWLRIICSQPQMDNTVLSLIVWCKLHTKEAKNWLKTSSYNMQSKFGLLQKVPYSQKFLPGALPATFWVAQLTFVYICY